MKKGSARISRLQQESKSRGSHLIDRYVLGSRRHLAATRSPPPPPPLPPPPLIPPPDPPAVLSTATTMTSPGAKWHLISFAVSRVGHGSAIGMSRCQAFPHGDIYRWLMSPIARQTIHMNRIALTTRCRIVRGEGEGGGGSRERMRMCGDLV